MSEVSAGRRFKVHEVKSRIAAAKPAEPSVLLPDVDNVADRLLDALDPGDVAEVVAFLRSAKKSLIAVLCERLQHGLEQRAPLYGDPVAAPSLKARLAPVPSTRTAAAETRLMAEATPLEALCCNSRSRMPSSRGNRSRLNTVATLSLMGSDDREPNSAPFRASDHPVQPPTPVREAHQ